MVKAAIDELGGIARFVRAGDYDLVAAPGAAPWSSAKTWEYVAKWLMRWNRSLTTKVGANYGWSRVEDLVFVDPVSATTAVQD